MTGVTVVYLFISTVYPSLKPGPLTGLKWDKWQSGASRSISGILFVTYLKDFMPSLWLNNKITSWLKGYLPSFKDNFLQSLRNVGNLFNIKIIPLRMSEAEETWKVHLDYVFKHLYLSIIALQWCVSFCCITKWISYTYTYIPISPPSWVSLPPSQSHPSRGSQSTELISLCYVTASH